jgi:hypothetical protein
VSDPNSVTQGVSLSGLGNPAAVNTSALLTALAHGAAASSAAATGTPGAAPPRAVAEIVDFPVTASMTLSGFSGTSLSPSQATAFTGGLAVSLGVMPSRITLITPVAATRAFTLSKSKSVTAAGGRRLLADLEVAFTVSGFGADGAAAAATMTVISTSAVASDSPVMASLAAVGVPVTLRIATAPSASVTVAITLQYDSPEAAAAGASAVSDAISGGALAGAIADVVPSITLEPSVLPELPAAPPPPGATTPAPVASSPPPPVASPPASVPQMAPAAAATTVSTPDGSNKQRTVALAVSLAVGLVIILLGAVLTAVSRATARRARAQADALAAEDAKLAPADELAARRPRRTSSVRASEPTRRNSLLGVVVDDSEEEEARTSTRSLNRAHLSSVTPYVSRTQLLGALVGADVDVDATLPGSPRTSDGGGGTSAPQRRRTPRTSAWRAPAVLGDGEETGALTRSDSLRSNSGKALRVRRSSVTK